MPELLTVDETAARLRVHPMTVRRHIKQGKLRAVRVGGRIRVRQEDLEEFMRPVAPFAQALVASLKPASPAELERRKALFEETMRLRAEIGPIGITTDELVHQARAEEEASYGR